MFGSILSRYEKQCETTENHKDEHLKTHYYKGSFKQIFELVKKLIFEDQMLHLENISQEHGEFSVKIKRGKTYFLIITVVAVRPYEVAVDLHISTESFSLFGSYPQLKNEIDLFYQKLNKQASMIGTGRGN
ncbi:hypothetical protein [Neobacillus sp. D3-1R]|uniref:hypothetical protein n=1 Tax=Neobacillus sp. D3-1R TaxID=3445778 RepID=UPI003FA1924E